MFTDCMVWQGKQSFLEAALKVIPQPLLFQQLLGAVRRGYYISSGNSAKNEKSTPGFFGRDGDGVV